MRPSTARRRWAERLSLNETAQVRVRVRSCRPKGAHALTADELRTQLQNQVLESLIRSALLTKRTHDLGYRVGREQLGSGRGLLHGILGRDAEIGAQQTRTLDEQAHTFIGKQDVRRDTVAWIGP